MQHIFRAQLPHELIGDQLVVLRSAHAFGYRLERKQEALKIFVVVELADSPFIQLIAASRVRMVPIVLRRQRGAMPPAQLRQRGRLHGAFQVEMQLRFRQLQDENAWTHGRPGQHG